MTRRSFIRALFTSLVLPLPPLKALLPKAFSAQVIKPKITINEELVSLHKMLAKICDEMGIEPPPDFPPYLLRQ